MCGLILWNKSGVDITTTKSLQQKLPVDWLVMTDQLTNHYQALCQEPPRKTPGASNVDPGGLFHQHLTSSPLHSIINLIAKFIRPAWGLPGADRTQVGPMFAPWVLLSGDIQFVLNRDITYFHVSCLLYNLWDQFSTVYFIWNVDWICQITIWGNPFKSYADSIVPLWVALRHPFPEELDRSWPGNC